MVELQNIHFNIGKKSLLKAIDLKISQGKLLVILGANGAGKSTLLKIISRSLSPSQGQVWLNAKPLEAYTLAALAKTRAVLSQHHTLSVSFKVKELIAMGRYPHFQHQPSLQDNLIVETVMHEQGLAKFASRDYNSLSGGEQQRCHLARVIAQIYDQPQALLLLDEPVNGLDIRYQQLTAEAAKNLTHRGYTVVMILHDINLAAQIADDILLLQQGEVVACGSPAEVLTEENLERTYNLKLKLIPFEGMQSPLVMPYPNQYQTTSI